MKTIREAGVLLLGGLLALSLLLGGCSGDDATGVNDEEYTPTAEDIDDSAQDFAVALADPEEGMLALWLGMGDIGFDGETAPMKPAGPVAVADTSFQRGPFTITIDRTFYDADGNPSEEYDSSSTVRMTRVLTLVGTRETFRRTASVDHWDSLAVDGIAPGDTIRTRSGEGRRTVSATFQARWRPVDRTFNAEHEWTVNDMQVNVDRVTYPFPLDGSIDVHTTMERVITSPMRTVTVEVEVQFTVSFDGTRYAEVVVVDGPTYWIDLVTGEIYRERPDQP